MASTLLVAPGVSFSGGADFMRDAAGRFIGMRDAAGNGTRYVYDAVGNLLSIQPLAGISVLGFSPAIGNVGSVVTIEGTGFSADPLQNAVSFNGVPATVSSASAARLVVSVPAGASTGPISVTAPAGSASSANLFVVDATYSAPTITSIAPTIGLAGSVVAVSGTNFDPANGRTKARLNRSQAAVSAVTATSLNAVVPPNTGSGRVRVSTASGSVDSGQDFYVPPAGSTVADVVFTGRLLPGDVAQNYAIGTAGKIGMLLFDAGIGDGFSIVIPATTLSGTVTVYGPNGVALNGVTGGVAANAVLDVRNLSVAGTYAVVVKATAAGNVSVGLKKDAGAALTVDGPVLDVTLGSNQNGNYTFAGLAGQRLGLGIGAVTTTPTAGGAVSVTVLNPAGAVLVNCGNYTGVGGTCTLPALPSAGDYKVRVDPAGTNAASLSLTLSADVTGVLVANAPATLFASTRVGQNARYTFDGTAGQNVGLLWSGSTYPTGAYNYYGYLEPNTLTIYKPDGSLLRQLIVGDGNLAAGLVDLLNLPVTGTYTVVMDPYRAAGQIKLQLLADASGTLVVDGAALDASLNAGQNGNYTFSGTAGQYLNLAVTGPTTTPVAGGWASVSVLSPTGTVLVNCGSYSSTGGICALPMLPTSGDYKVRVDVAGTNAASLSMSLSADVTGVLVANAPATLFASTRVGQNARYTFNGTAGQNLGLLWSGSTYPTGPSYYSMYGQPNTLAVYKPDGTLLQQAVFGDGSLATGVLDLLNLPVSGTYTAVVNPYGLNLGQINVQLLADASGTLVVDGAVLDASLNVGQNGNYTFSGVAGQNLNLAVTAITTTPTANGAVTVTVLNPAGAQLVSCGSYSGAAGGACTLPTLPSSGDYKVRVDAAGTNAASVKLTLSADVPGTLVVDGAVAQANPTRLGQGTRHAFTGTAGQYLNLGVTAITTTPTANGAVTVTVLNPAGAVLVNCGNYTGAGGTCALPVLPSSGDYQVAMDPVGANTVSVSLTLSADVTGVLVANAPATLFASTRVGQNARYTFNGTAGQNVGLLWSGSTYPTGPYGYYGYSQPNMLAVYKPDGTLLQQAVFGDGSLATGLVDLLNLPVSGTYTVVVNPYGLNLGQINVQLLADASGTLVVDGAALDASLNAGQNGNYTFTGTAGQNLNLAVTSIVTTPTANGAVAVKVLDPAGAQLVSCGGYSGAGATCTLPVLPTSGDYRVRVDVAGTNAASLSLTLSADVTGVLVANAPATLFASTRVGQNARYTFSGTAGQNLGLLWSGSTYPTGPYGYYGYSQPNTLAVYKPDGTLLQQAVFGDGSLATGLVDLLNLPVSGTYTVVVNPYGLNLGQINVQLLADASGTLVVDGAALDASLNAGQNGNYTFTGMAGQNLNLAVTSIVTTPTANGAVAVKVLDPAGAQLVSCGNYTGAAGGACALPALPSSGDYKVRIDPAGSNAAQFRAQLMSR